MGCPASAGRYFSTTALPVATVKGLVGEPGRNRDLTPAATTNAGGCDRSNELSVGFGDHSGGVADFEQQIC
jgi:hypothetical protein